MNNRLLLAALSSALLITSHTVRAMDQADRDALDALLFGDDKVVESATRFSKPLRQVAENVTVIRAEEIDKMNVHSLHDVLARVPGVFMDYYSQEMNGLASLNILGSRQDHVLVLIDGVRLNSAADGAAQLQAIHPSVVDRIEVIKGPASSVWGSSLGGVVNIFTKEARIDEEFHGSLSGSWGVMETGDVHGEMTGRLGKLGYYVNAGRQDSDGLENQRFFRSDDFYTKLSLALPHDTNLIGTFGYGDPFFRPLNNPVTGNDQQNRDRIKFFTLGLDTRLREKLTLYVGARRLTRDLNLTTYNAGINGNYYGADLGELIYSDTWSEVSSGINAHLSWRLGQHSLALGGEFNREGLDKSSLFGKWAQANWGTPATDSGTPGADEVRGIYASDTIRFGDWAVTPGIRYDSHSISGGILSPSLGATWMVTNETLLRAQVAKGFVQPILSYAAVSDLYYTANPELKPEKITSWQAGVETTAIPYLRAKSTFFIHQVDDEWVDMSPWTNGGSVERHGVELDLETITWHDFSARANYTYYYIIPDDARANDSAQVANLILRYDNYKQFQAELAGHYIWWDEFYTVSGGIGRGDYGTMLWDLNLSREFDTEDLGKRLKVFAIAHNLFDGHQCSNTAYPNPGRWVEAGVKWSF